MAAGKPQVSMTEGPLLPVIVRVAVPIILSQMLVATYQIVNALFVGQLGGDAIAAIAASGPLFGILLSLGSGLATAGAVLIAQYAGARRADMVDHVAAQTLLMVAGVAICFALAGLLLARPALAWIGVDPAIQHLAWTYLSISYLGMVPLFGFMAIQGMLQAVGEVRFAFQVMVASILLNVALDPILIFGIGPVPALGVAGAAIASVTAQALALLIIFHRVINGKSALHLKRGHFSPDLAHMRRALGIGLPASIEQATRTFGSLVLMTLAAHFGTAGLATYGLGTRVLLFFFTPMIGMAVATATIVGQNIGAGRPDRAAAAGKACAWLSFGSLSVVGLLLMPAAPAIMRALAPHEPWLIEQGTMFVWIFAPFLGVMAVPQVLCGAFRGAGNTLQSMGISMTMQWLFQLPSAWVLALSTTLGVMGVAWSYPIANAMAGMLAIGWFVYGPWRRSLVGQPA